MSDKKIDVSGGEPELENLIYKKNGSFESLPFYNICDETEGKIIPFFCRKFGYLAEDGALFWDDDEVWDSSFIGERNGRSVCVLGDKICVFPDKVYYDITLHKSGNIEAEVSLENENLSVTFDDGTIPTGYCYSATEPENASANSMWVQKDLSMGIYNVWRKGDGNSVWDIQDTVCYRVNVNGASDIFSVGQKVSVSGLTTSERGFGAFDGVYRVAFVSQNDIYLEHKPDKMVLPRICRASTHHLVALTLNIERRVPNISLPTASHGRIWALDDKNRVRASAKGDIFSWETEDGEEDDSVTLYSYGTSTFLFSCEYENAVCFAGANEIVFIKGTKPDNFTLRGHKIGGARGVCRAHGTVYRVSGDGELYSATSSKSKSLGVTGLNPIRLIPYDKYILCVEENTTKIINTEDYRVSTATTTPQFVWNEGNITHFCIYDGENTRFCTVADDSPSKWRLASGLLAVEGGTLVDYAELDIEGEGEVRVRFNTPALYGIWRSFPFKGRRKIRIPTGMRELDFVEAEIAGECKARIYKMALLCKAK